MRPVKDFAAYVQQDIENKLCNDLQSETRTVANLYYNLSEQKNYCSGDNHLIMLESRFS